MMRAMSLASSLRSYIGARHLFILFAVIGASLLATKGWNSALWISLTSPPGPYVEFELRLPPGILLPDDKNIQLTLWANDIGRGCGRVIVRRWVKPPEIAGKCSVVVTSTEYIMSMRLSHFSEGYWKMPIGIFVKPDPVFTPWQHVEFTRAPVGEKEFSALPHGAYYIRYLVRS